MRIIECPTCDAEIPLDEQDREGDTIFCPYCGTPIKLVRKGKEEELEGEEDEDYEG